MNPDNVGSDVLRYNVEYVLWTFDYGRSNRVFLGRHGQKLMHQEDPQFLYSLGLRPKEHNQTWKVTRKREIGKGVDDCTVARKGPVPYGSPVCMTVGGSLEIPYGPDSSTRLYLSAHELSMGALWYTFRDRESCIDEDLYVYQSSEYIAIDDKSRIQSSALDSSERSKNSPLNSDRGISERDVIVHAIPSIMDGGYLFYAPESLRDGQAECELHHAAIPCHFWIEDGMFIFHAYQSLPFKFGVPVLEEDAVDHNKGQTEALAVLLAKNSSRWWAIKHYFSTAANVEEGREFHMDIFLRNSKDHEDHLVVYEKENKFVHIIVGDAVVDKNIPDVPRRMGDVWRFSICG
jgi:hypothetical protein